MTIEEAIIHAREVAEGCPAEDRQCAYQHDKLADWLEELKAYKETGLEPRDIKRFKENYSMAIEKYADYAALGTVEEAKELFFARGSGRLITLSCKVTDTVYVLESVFKGKKAVREQVVPAQIDRVIIGGTTGQPVYDLCSETGKWYKSMNPGEDFYLTAEEAEMAMKEGAGHETKSV